MRPIDQLKTIFWLACTLNALGNRFQDKYPLLTYVDINLSVGDIIVDVATGDVGLLVSRYSIYADLLDDNGDQLINLWAWELYWTGPNPNANGAMSRYQPYTESGLLNLIRTGTFIVEKRE